MSTAKEVVDRALESWHAADQFAFSRCYSDSAEITGPGGMRLHGQAGASQFLAVWTEAMPDNRITVADEYLAGPVVVQEATFTGTHTGNLVAPDGRVVPPTGRRVEIPYVDILHVDGDRITSDHLYWDQAEMLSQLGLTAAQPPGT